MTTTKTTKTVTIERRGHFDDDSFFKDTRNDWDTAMKDAIDRWEKKTNTTSKRTTHISSLPPKERHDIYRQIRISNVTADESQAVSCTEEDHRYRMVMDVKDFNRENINVKAVDDTIVVEGHIEKKEGNSVSSTKFVRKFLLPPGVNMTSISSALSRDGILTIYAPKLVATKKIGDKSTPTYNDDRVTTKYTTTAPTGRDVKIIRNFAAGKPSDADWAPFNPTGGAKETHYTKPGKVYEISNYSTPTGKENNTVWTTTDGDKWTSFDTMVERSQREMNDMMKKHSINSYNDHSFKNDHSIIRAAPANALSSRDVARIGNSVTEREEKRWDDFPKPGLNRSNKVVKESTEIKDYHGNVIGHKNREEFESNASGEKEEILPDGTKRKIFTKSYETKNSYKSSTNPKAL